MIMERAQNSVLSVHSPVRADKYLQPLFATCRACREEVTFEVSNTNSSQFKEIPMRHLTPQQRLSKLLTPLCLPVLLFSFAARLAAQQTCMPPGMAQQSSSQNIFSERQEMDLGDAVAEHLQRDYKVIDDEEVTAHLRQIADRIIRNLPPTELKFQLYLFDINDVNAFTLPGGRIYISRKMVAFARNEDELAGVIAHELGHIVARHATVD